MNLEKGETIYNKTNLNLFFNTNNLLYNYIWYYIKDKTLKKTPLFEFNKLDKENCINKMIKQNDNLNFYMNKPNKDKDHEFSLNEYNSLTFCYSVFLKHCDDIYVIDIDDLDINTTKDLPELEYYFFKDNPFIEGNTKGIHIYIKIKNMIEYKNQQDILKNVKGDLIKLNNCWEKFNKKVFYKKDIKIKEYDWNDLKDIFNLKKMNIIDDNYELENDYNSIMSGVTQTTALNYIPYKSVDTNSLYTKNIKEQLIELADIIDLKYINNYKIWLNIVWGLKQNNIYNKDIALYITKRSPLFKDECYFESIWNQYEQYQITVSIGTFYYYAKISDPISYQKIVVNSYFNYINQLLKFPTQENMAVCFYKIYGAEFMFYNNDIYWFNNMIWEKSKTALRRKFTTDFTKIFIDLQINNLNTMKNLDPEDDKYLTLSDKNKLLTKIISNLQTNKNIKDICNDSIKPYIEKINIKFEKNSYLFCFNNIIYDLDNLKFIDYCDNENYMILTTGYDYR